MASELWADDRPSKSKSKPKPERLAGSIVTIKKQVKKGNSSRHLSSQCIDTPDWVDIYGDSCEWYETNDEPGCPDYGSDYDGGMGLPMDNCCHCQAGTTPTPTKTPVAGSPSSGCIDTPNWVDSYGDSCEWYETNDEPGCPDYGSDYDGGMGLPKDNCCHCKEQWGTMSPTPAPALCSKYDTSGWHHGIEVQAYGPDQAPNGSSWSWEECAKECTYLDACQFWTLQLSGDKKCLIMSNKGDYVAGQNLAFEGDKDWSCAGVSYLLVASKLV